MLLTGAWTVTSRPRIRALLISDGSAAQRALSVMRCLDAGGIQSAALLASGGTALRFSRLCGAFVRARALIRPGGPEFVAQVKQLCREHRVDIVIPLDVGSAIGLEATEMELPALPFPHAPSEVLLSLFDKWTFAGAVADLGLRTPRTAPIDSTTDLDALQLPYPLVLKPRDREGGEGVVKVDSPQMVRAHVAASPYALLVQEMIDGEDLDFSFLADHGRLLAWTIHFTPTPGVFRFAEDAEVLLVGRTVVEGLRLHGTGNIDLMRDRRDHSLRVIECNPVFWETVTASAYAGVNFAALGVRKALGVETGYPAQGDLTYLSPRRLVAEILRRRTVSGVSNATWRGALAVASDPLPALLQALGTRLQRA